MRAIRLIIVSVCGIVMTACDTGSTSRKPGPSTVNGASAVLQQPPSSDGIDVATILDAMVKRYRECDTYADEGSVHVEYRTANNVQNKFLTFKTAFEREKRFRFEWAEIGSEGQSEQTYVVLRDRDGVVSWESPGPSKRQESLDTVLGSWHGISSGVSTHIPTRLYVIVRADLQGQPNADNYHRLEDGVIDDDACFRLRHWNVVIWIDKESHLIRRIRSQGQYPDFTTVTVEDYNPLINAEIADRFQPVPNGN
jgi:hypothetical protein